VSQDFEGIADVLSVGLATLDGDGVITYANPALAALVAAPAADLVGRPFDDPDIGSALDGRPAAADELPFAVVRTTLEPVHGFEHEILDPSGALVRVIGVDMTPRLDEGGNFVGAIAVAQDVTARVAARHALEESAERFKRLADDAPDGMFVQQLHPTVAFTYVNAAMERITGFSAARILDDPDALRAGVHPDDRAKLTAALAEPTRLSDPVDVRFNAADGRTRALQVRGAPMFDAAGRLVAVQGALIDITARREHEQTLQRTLDDQARATQELQRINELKTTFVQAVSHELRTPLTGILGFAELLEHRRLTEGQRTLLAGRIVQAARRLSSLLDDVFDIDRLDRSDARLQREPVELRELVERIVAATDATGHELRCVGESVTVEVDPPLFERAVDNLVRNAIRHTPPGTRVVVHVEDPPAIVVTDDGPGVHDEIRTTLFDPFVQGPGSLQAARPGTGVGLSLVQRVAHLHGWEVELLPSGADGASFRLAPARASA
jgi:PAS domain S-box-containing protein